MKKEFLIHLDSKTNSFFKKDMLRLRQKENHPKVHLPKINVTREETRHNYTRLPRLPVNKPKSKNLGPKPVRKEEKLVLPPIGKKRQPSLEAVGTKIYFNVKLPPIHGKVKAPVHEISIEKLEIRGRKIPYIL